MFLCFPRQSWLQRRRCVFQVKNKDSDRYAAAGNVSDSVQLCENTHCCTAIYRIINESLKVDTLGKNGSKPLYSDEQKLVFTFRASQIMFKCTCFCKVCFIKHHKLYAFHLFCVLNFMVCVCVLACDLIEKSCPDETCKPTSRINGLVVVCVCSTDLCNNVTFPPAAGQPLHTHSYPARTLKRQLGNTNFIVNLEICQCWFSVSFNSSIMSFILGEITRIATVVIVPIFVFIIFAVKWRRLCKEQGKKIFCIL